MEGYSNILPLGKYDERLGNLRRIKRGIDLLTRLTVHKTNPVITISNSTVAVKVIPVTYALVRTTIRHAFQLKSITIILRITYTTVMASQAITLRIILTSLILTNLTPIIVRRGLDPEREFNRLVPVTLKTIKLTLITSRLTNLS